MSFSKQDARYEAKPLDLSEYSAVDMMADLGLHRRVSLPLQGRATIIPPPPPDIHKRGPMLAKIAERDSEIQTAWGSVFDPDLVEGRHDGLGTGQMHRTGQNFNPDEVRQRSPVRPRRARSAEGSGIGGRFELGRRPGKAPHPRQLPEPFQAQRRVRERGGTISPDELNPEGDLMAELLVESRLRMAKYKSARSPARIVGHHIAGNSPIAPRAPSRAVSMLSFHSSKMIPPNPLVSQWGAGNKLATASAGYNYAEDLDAKKAGKTPTGPAPQDRALNKVNNTALKAPPSPATPVPHHLAPKTVPPPTFAVPPGLPSTKTVLLTIPGAARSTLPPRQAIFPDTTQFFPPITNGTWAGDKPFGAEAEQKLADITNVDNTSKVGNSTTGTAKPIAIQNELPSLVLEQKRPDLEKSSTDLPTTDDQDETFADAVQSREPLGTIFAMDSIEDSYASSEFDQPLASDSSIFSTVGLVRGRESLSESSGHMEQDNMSELLSTLQTIGGAVQELKTKCLDYEGFEATLITRLGEIRRLQKDILSEISVEEDSMLKLKKSISALRAKRVAVAETLRTKEIEKADEKEKADATMEAELKAMIYEHEALMKEHEDSEAGGATMVDVTMADIEEEEEPVEENFFTETIPDIEENPIEEESSISSTPRVGDGEEENLVKEEPFAETRSDIEELINEGYSAETTLDTEGEDSPIEERPPTEAIFGTEEGSKKIEDSFVENERIEKEDASLKNNHIQRELGSELERARGEKYRLENESAEEQTRKLETVRIEPEHIQSEAVGVEGARLRQTLVSAETIRREKVEKDGLTAELLKREQESYLLQEAIDKAEFDLKLGKVEKDFRWECAEADRAAAEQGRTIEHTIAGANNKQLAGQVENGLPKNTHVGRPETQSKKDQKPHSERERHEHVRIDTDNRRTRAETFRREEEELVREHLEKVRRQEERFKVERAERQRAEGEGLHAEHDEKPRHKAAILEKESQRALVRDRGETVSLEKRFGGIRIEKRVVRNKPPAVEQSAMGPVRQLVFEQRRSNFIPEPITRLTSPELPDTTATDTRLTSPELPDTTATDTRLTSPELPDTTATDTRLTSPELPDTTATDTRLTSPEPPDTIATENAPFPYTLELDLKPMYGPNALQVNIGQFDKPQDAILKRCSEVLSPLQHRELSEIPDFQTFLAECDKRHCRKMAKAYGNSGRG